MQSVGPISTLTVVPDKAHHYCGEVFFREAWEDWSAVWGADAVEAAHSYAAMLFKPDGVAARMIDPAVDFLGEHGFTPAAAVAVELDRATTRWLWLYRFNVASVDRVRLHDLVNTAGPGLFLILRDDRRGAGEVPATVRLTDLKGPSRPERRRPDQLRSRLGVSDRLVNFIHTSDEPADLLRELAILTSPEERLATFAALAGADSGAADWAAVKRQVEAALPPHSFDGEAAVERIRAHAAAALDDGRANGDRERLQMVLDLAGAAAAGDDAAATALWTNLRSGDTPVPRWDVVSLGSRTIEYDEPGTQAQTLGDAPPAAWREPGNVVRAYFAALNERDVDRAVSLWKPGARQNVRGQVDTTAPAGVSEQMAALFAAIPDASFELVSVTVDAERCAVQWRLRGTFDGRGLFYGVRPTGSAVVLEGADIFAVSGGAIHANDAFSDSMEFVRQIGMMPPRDSFVERLMTGAFNLRTRLRRALTRR